MAATRPPQRRAPLAFAALLPLTACAPATREQAGAPSQTAAEFLAACATGDDADWRSYLVRAECDDPQWSRGAFPGGRVLDVELRDRLAIAHVSPASPSSPTRPLVLRLEDQSWKISLAESLAAWAAEPPRRMELLARP